MVTGYDLFFIFFLLLVSTVLVNHFRTTKIKDFLLLAGLFIFTLSHRMLLLFTDIQLDHVYSDSINFHEFMFIIKANLVLSVVAWYCIAVLSYRMIYKNFDLRFYFMTAHAAIVLVTALFLKMDIVPSQTTIFGIEAHTLDMSGRGAIFEVQGQIINGQGYYYLLIMFRALASLSIWYALFTAKNEYKYPKFNRIRIIWLFSMGSYFITQCLELSIIFLNSESEIMYLIIRIFSILAMISLLFITFFMPEGLILTKSQIFRVAQLLKEQDIDIQNGKRGIFYTPNEYIEFLNNHFTDE